MKRFFFFSFFIFFLSSSVLMGIDPLSADNEQDQPKSIGKMKAIVFIDEKGEIIKDPSLEGIQFVGIKVPGAHWSRSGFRSHLESRFLHRDLSMEDLEEIRGRVILYYKEKGSSVVQVVVPPQDVTEGILHFIVTESRVGEVTTEGNIWSSAKFTKQIAGLKRGDKIDTNELNAALTFLNKNPFKNTDVIFAPGNESYTTNVELITSERRPYRVYAGVDNRGTETIGNYRQFEGFYCGDFLGLDHIFSYQLTTSLPLKRMHAHAAYYEIPLPHRTALVAFGGYSSVRTKSYSEVMENSGINVQVSGRYHFPLSPWGKAVNDTYFGFDYKRANNNVLFSDLPVFGSTATLSQFVLGYQYQDLRKEGWGLFTFELYISPAKWFTNQNKADYQQLSPGALPRYLYFVTSWEKNFHLPHCMRLSMRLKGQYANQNLLPSEQLGLGGYETVRGYHEREINGDNGFLGNLEFKSPLFSLFRWKNLCKQGMNVNADSVQDALLFIFFLDYGFVNRHKNVSGVKNTQYIASVGPGLEYQIDPYLQVGIYWGIRLKSTPFTSAPGGGANFSVVASF